MKALTLISIAFILGGTLCFHSNQKNIQSNENSDTLHVNYTYWWPTGGPFTGLCGNPYSLVFTGTVTKLFQPAGPYPTGRNIGEVLYYPQKGVIEINEMKFKQPPSEGYDKTPGHNYSGEKYFSSDCFYHSGLKEGDKVIVFIYSYEGEYSIPSQSILKIENYHCPAVSSIEKYIQSNQNPLAISADTTLWETYNQKYALKQLIECRLWSRKQK